MQEMQENRYATQLPVPEPYDTDSQIFLQSPPSSKFLDFRTFPDRSRSGRAPFHDARDRSTENRRRKRSTRPTAIA